MPAVKDHSRSLIDCLLLHAAQNPGRDAIVSPDYTLDYATLTRLVAAQAQVLLDAGVTADSVVGIKSADDTRHLLLCLSATCLGATSCTIPVQDPAEMQQMIIDRCAVTHLVDDRMAIDPATSGGSETMDSALDPAPDARLLFSTSGTTGEPKLVIHHATDLVLQAHRHVNSSAERFLCLATMENNFVKRHRLYCLAMGATNIMLDVDPETLVAQCQSMAVNVIHVSAFQAQELLAYKDIASLSGIRLKLGGSHVPVTLRRQLRAGITSNLQAGYGTTETGAIGFTEADDAEAGESVGQPLPGIEVRAIAGDGTILPGGEPGELLIRGAGMFRGYLGNPELTDTRLRDGWFHTGDIGYLDEQQRIHLCGRSDDMFVFNSINIYPQDIESQICQYPGVVDAAVLPKASPVHGDIPIALVVFAPGIEPDLVALRQYLQERVGVRCPRQFSIVDEIPRNATGKIARKDVASLSKSLDQIRSHIVQALGDCDIEPIKPALLSAFESGQRDIELDQIGLDSLARMNLLVALEVEHDLVVTPQEFGEFDSLGDIVTSIAAQHRRPQANPDKSLDTNEIEPPVVAANDAPHIVRLFQRVFGFCDTVAQVHKVIATLECRLTPLEFECLRDWHQRGQLISRRSAAKFHETLSGWMEIRERMLRDSGKPETEPYVRRRIAPTVTHYSGPGAARDKTLLICFATRGGHQLSIANSTLMQHTDSKRYDLLIIAEPLNEGYWHGVPFLGRNMREVIDWIGSQSLIHDYASLRTMGCSAGAYPALIAGYLLNAERALCVGGRFHPRRFPLRNLDKLFTTWRATRRGHCARVVLSYAADEARDRKFVHIMAELTRASCAEVEFTDGKVGHGILTQLTRRGELAPFLQRTIFAAMDDELIAGDRANTVLSFPLIELRPQG